MSECVNFIDGEWVPSATGRFRDNLNPATGEVLGQVTQSDEGDLDRAVAAAVAAQQKWRLVPAPERADVLYRAGQLLKERKEELSQALTKEMGKVIAEARGEVQEGIDMAFFMAGEGRRLVGDTTPSELPNKFAMSVRAPVGIAGLITPWNFPIAIATWKAFPAIVGGNAVVWKPATETPVLANMLVGILEEAGLPKGVMNLVYGSGQVVGEAMVEHPDIDIISFTGSTEIGRSVAEKGGRHLKRVSLEMGGKNGIIVMDDADLKLAVDGIIWSGYGTSGQRCTAASRVIVHRAVKEQLEEMLLERIRNLTLGNGLDESVDVGPVINPSALNKIHGYVKIGKEEGARLTLWRRGGRYRRTGKGPFLSADLVYGRGAFHAHCARRNFRSGHFNHSGRQSR